MLLKDWTIVRNRQGEPLAAFAKYGWARGWSFSVSDDYITGTLTLHEAGAVGTGKKIQVEHYKQEVQLSFPCESGRFLFKHLGGDESFCWRVRYALNALFPGICEEPPPPARALAVIAVEFMESKLRYIDAMDSRCPEACERAHKDSDRLAAEYLVIIYLTH